MEWGSDPKGGTVRLVFPALSGFYAIAEPLSYAALRFAFGIILLTHGMPKLLGSGHGATTIAPLARSVGHIENVLNLPFPWAFGYFIMFLETGGALMLAFGLFTRIVAPMIAVEMAAICFVLAPTWIWFQTGMEYPLLMGFLALYISFKGGSRYSLDRILGREI
ncbi:DoxX family protein [Azospirillum sp. TSO35-2]|nr:DoxX family protein [Azospirillum sp. TSO35-2]